MTRKTTLETKSDFLSPGRCARGAAVSNDRLSWMYRLLQVLPSDNEKRLWEDLERLVIKIEMRGMIPMISGLVDSKRLPKVAVVALSALSWFVGKFFFF